MVANILEKAGEKPTEEKPQPQQEMSYTDGMTMISKMSAVDLIKTFGHIDKEQPFFIQSKTLKKFFKENNIKGLPWIRYDINIDRIIKIADYRKLTKKSRATLKKSCLKYLNDRIKAVRNLDISDKQKEHRINNLEKAVHKIGDDL